MDFLKIPLTACKTLLFAHPESHVSLKIPPASLSKSMKGSETTQFVRQ